MDVDSNVVGVGDMNPYAIVVGAPADVLEIGAAIGLAASDVVALVQGLSAKQHGSHVTERVRTITDRRTVVATLATGATKVLAESAESPIEVLQWAEILTAMLKAAGRAERVAFVIEGSRSSTGNARRPARLVGSAGDARETKPVIRTTLRRRMSFDGSATLFGAGTTLGPYRIVRALGQGGMGTVYEAVHTRLNKRVALKTLHRRLAMNPEATERFVREGRAAARLRHAHAVDVADVAIEDGTPYLVMEFLEGEDLSKLIERSAPLSSEQVVEVMLPVCAAIAAAHDEGIVHRDLKPENIFLARPKHGGLHPKVLDFGISKLVEADRDQLTNAESVLGSPYYMSPEHARGARYVNAGSDQYSLGVILYEALTGRRPIQKETLFAQLDAIMTETPMAPREIRPEIPPALEKIVLRAMDRDASQRFESVLALGRALLPFGSERTRAVWEPMFGAMPVDAAPPTPATPPTSAIPVAPSASATPAIPQTLEAVLPDTIAVGGDALAPSLGSTTLGASITRVVPAPRVARETPRWVMLGALAVVLIGGAGAVWRLTTSTPSSPAVRPATVASTPPRTYRANVTASPATATITIDDAPSGTGSTNAEFAANGATHWLRVTAPGYEPLAIAFRDEPPPARVELHAIAPSAPTIAAPAVPSTVQATHVERTQATHVATNPVTSRPSTGTHHPATRATTPRHPTIPQTSTQTHRPANGSRIVY